MDNLIAEKKIKPMLVVMTNGLTDGSWAGGSSVEGMDLLEDELLNDVKPLIEQRFNVGKDKSYRAIAGLSMGGGQAFVIGMRNKDTFQYIGQFSSGLLSDPAFDFDRYIPNMSALKSSSNGQAVNIWSTVVPKILDTTDI
ncbi:alpha/beta hydrolase [Sphingobacterium multivorum]|nr:alpha/beta hydrolase-fold protein [Sphingobacterium multivorum]